MVHKKYITRGGKKFGPYLYENYRVNGKTKTRYLGLAKSEETKNNLQVNYLTRIIGIVLIVGVLFFSLYIISNRGVTGKATVDISDSYSLGQEITGNFNLLVKKGELIPANSVLKIKLGNQEKTISLNELTTNEKVSGDFYAENANLQGQGEGFGVVGTRTIYPDVDFILLILKNEEEQTSTPVTETPTETTTETTKTTAESHVETTTESHVEVPIETPAPEISETPAAAESTATVTETPAVESVPVESIPVESAEPAPEPSPITGQAIKENSNKIEIQAKVSKNQVFTYTLGEGELAEIKQNSVEVEGKKIDDNLINLNQQGTNVEVTTSYQIEEQGFGQEYLQDETLKLEINLEQFGIIAEQGTLEVSLVYQDTEIIKTSEEILVEQAQENETEIMEIPDDNETIEIPDVLEDNETMETNITIPEQNITGLNLTNFTLPETNLTNITIVNETIENITIENLTENNVITLQYKAVINKPVKWLKKINFENTTDDFNIEIPKEAENITIKTGEEFEQEEANAKDYGKKVEDIERTSLITGSVVFDSSSSKKRFFSRLFSWIGGRGITGEIIYEQDSNIIETENGKIVDLSQIVQNVAENESIGIVYETPAPLASEENLSNGKKIIIYSDGEYNYTDVLAYTLLDNLISVNQSYKLKLYWLKEAVVNEAISSNEEVQTVNEQENSDIVETFSNETIIIDGGESEIISNESNEQIDNGSNEEVMNNNEAVQTINNSSLDNKIDESVPSEPASEGVALTGNFVEEFINEDLTTIEESRLVREEVAFIAEDLDSDGFIDYIEWVVPHLSNQTYELVIEISKAEHLDENRTLIEDVYDIVKEKDDNWTEIAQGDYLRVSFEQPLDRTRDITIYARGNSSSIGVYEKDSDVEIARFENVSEEKYYKIYLTNLSECYDNETKVLTEEGWKYFADLNDEKVATLNNLTGELEWQQPTEKQVFDNNKEMYKIETEGGELVVSENHKVYSSVVESNLANSFELNTFIIDFLSNFSSDHKGQLYFSANARYGTSLECSGNRLQAFGINSLNSSSGTNFILVSKIDMTSKNSSSVLCVFDNISSLLLANSTNINSGAIKCNLLETNISLASLLPLINKENNSLASTTTIIYLHSLDLSLLANASFTFLPSLNASSCVNSLSLVKDSKTLSCSTFFENASLATSDQLIILNPSILSLSSSGKDNVIFTILNSSCDEHINYVYTHVFKPFGLNKITDVYSELNSGKEVYFLNSENKPVKVNNIEKVKYSGKIYDVDVPNDIVLVRRGNSSAIWSGNSNNYTQETFDLRSSGDIEYDYVVDPEGDTNTWICTANNLFSNAACWSLGSVPVAGENVVFNGTYRGSCNVTNNTMPQNLNSFTVADYSGTIYFEPLFAVGTWGTWSGTQLWNVTNNINITNGTIKIYGDAYNSSSVWWTTLGMRNITNDGHGQEWRSVLGNISIGAPSTLDGVGLGFGGQVGSGIGPGGSAYATALYGGMGGGNSNTNLYGNASAPTSLGSSGSGIGRDGGSAIKLQGNLVKIDGAINIVSLLGGSGGSIWLKANNISGTGTLNASGKPVSVYGGGGGRIRLEYGSSMSFSGILSVAGGLGSSPGTPGTLTFTNNTWPGDWNLTGNIGLLGGDFGDGATINVLGNFNTNNYNMTIYGDCFYSVTNPVTCYNRTADGRGVWINASGNITVTSGSVLDGVGLGFPYATGPGRSTSAGGSYGGKGAGIIYGNETAPMSLGSGGGQSSSGGAGSAVKLESVNNLIFNGALSFMGATPSAGNSGSSGGSIWLKANNISGSGTMNASGRGSSDSTSGGGRIALTSSGTIGFSGIIENKGGLTSLGLVYSASGGTVYINATTSISLSGNISVAGFNGSSVGSDRGQRINISAPLITLSGIYNATRYNNTVPGTVEGAINIVYTNCAGSSTLGASFMPSPPNYQTACSGIGLCDAIGVDDTCYIYTTKNLASQTISRAGNLVIQNGGSLFNDTTGIITINLGGNLTIESGGNISLYGKNGTTFHGGNLTINAHTINLSSGSKILAMGSERGTCSYCGSYAGDGGKIVLNVTKIYLDGIINSTGGSIAGERNGWAGDGGSLFINTTNDFEITGTIQLTSGGGGDRCGIELPTSRRVGGKISIGNYVGVNVSGAIDTRGAQCDNIYYNQTINFFPNSFNLRELNVKLGGNFYFGGNLNVSNLIVSGVLGPVGQGYYPGGNLSITADVLNLSSSGNISARGGDIPSTGYEQVGGYGGLLNITANTAYLDGTIEIRGGDGNVGRGEGGWAGKLFMNIKNDYALRGSIIGKGGVSGQIWWARGCDGGTAVIYSPGANVSIPGIINLSIGGSGDCYIKSRGGLLNITAYNLSITNFVSAIGNVSGIINLNARNSLTINSSVDAKTGGLTTGGLNGSVYLEYSNIMNLTSSTISPDPYITRNTTNARLKYLQQIFSSNAINYDNAIKISSNNISVDSSSYSQLNKSAELWFYNPTASNPVPLRNNIACPSTICSVISSGTIYKFNVTSFTDYSVGDGTPAITIVSPLAGNYSTSIIDFNISIDRDSSYCNFSLDNQARIDMTRFNGTYFNFTNSTMLQGNHNITFSCNDSNYNVWGNTSLRYFFLDYTAPDVTINSPKNTTLHYAPTMYFNTTASDNSGYVETCKYSLDGSTNTSMNKLNATHFTYDYSGIIHGFHNLTIFCNDSYGNIGQATEYNFRVIFTDLTMPNITLPSMFYSNYSVISIVISNEGPPPAESINISCKVGNDIYDSKIIPSIGSGENYTSNCTGAISSGVNRLLNITLDPENTVLEKNESNNEYTAYINITDTANIAIITVNQANTTDLINIQGLFSMTNTTPLANKKFTIKLNNTLVSSNTLNYTNLTGTRSNVNTTTSLQLNLSNQGDLISYSDNFATTRYQSDSIEYSNAGWTIGRVFELDSMTQSIGNITYKYDAITNFYSANVLVKTQETSDGNGNTSILYSFDNSTWVVLNTTKSKAANMTGNIPVDGKPSFYVRLKSDTTGGTENPVIFYQINYSSYNYSSTGNFTSENIYLANITYIALKWTQSLNDGAISLQLRESDDASNWDAWNTYLNSVESSISNFTKPYLQYRVLLSSTNLSKTPVFYGMQVLYFNASTNSSGGYNYNITIPTTTLGNLPLDIAVSPTESNLVGSNRTYINIWARTSLTYYTVKNYLGSESNYTVVVNLTRPDTGEFVNGDINVTISNATRSSTNRCYGAVCSISVLIPSNFAYGNYSINITANNESSWYRNTSSGFLDYLEEKNTTGLLYASNKTIADFAYGTDYSFYWNVTLNNTGRASMDDINVYYNPGVSSSDIRNVSEISPCSQLLPGQSCKAGVMITIDKNSQVGETYPHRIAWRANWTDNDGSISGGAGFISETGSAMYITILGNASLSLGNYSVNLSVQHDSSRNFTFLVRSVGSTELNYINLSFTSENLPVSWVRLGTYWISGLAAGQSQSVRVETAVPSRTTPGNYSGIINVSSLNGGEQYLNLSISVPINGSWYIQPSENLSYVYNFSLSEAGYVGNYTVFNIGNVNLILNLSYSPGRTTLYNEVGVFTQNYTVNNEITNPLFLNVEKGGNTSFKLYQTGYPSGLNDIGILFRIYNESANPSILSMQEAFYIRERPPTVSDVFFYFDDVVGGVAEINKNITIKVRATDDIGLNKTATVINVSYSESIVSLNGTSLEDVFGEYVGGTKKTVLNYTANFTPTTTGTHSVRVNIFDLASPANSYLSAMYNFTAYGVTSVNLSQNVSSIDIPSIDKNNKFVIYVNFSVNNLGNTSAYDSNLSYSKSSSIIISNYSFGEISRNSVSSVIRQINVSQLVWPGQYNITTSLTWRNPDATYSTDSKVLTINVLSNKSIDYSPSSLNITVLSGQTNYSILTINNSGNDNLTSISLSCLSGTICSGLTLAFNESSFNIAANSSRNVNVSLSAGSSLGAGYYSGVINISEQNISKTINIYSTVPESLSWALNLESINLTRGTSSSGDLQEVKISNTGNVNLTLFISSNNASLIDVNVSSVSITTATNRSIMLNYSTSSSEGSYTVLINITNSTASPAQRNVTVILTVTRTNVTIISPTTSSPLTNLTSGVNVSFLANVSYADTIVSSNVTWSASIGGSSCSNISYSYLNSNVGWNISCNVPSLTDGGTYNLTLTMTHPDYGTIIQNSLNSIVYRDLTAPVFNIVRNNVNKSSAINLQVNITDNLAISSVSAVLIYPNSSYNNITLILTGGLYSNNSIVLDFPGEYLVNYSANDTTGNLNSTVDWFEVYDKYTRKFVFSNYLSAPIANMNMSLLRPNSTLVFMSNLTSSQGDLNLYLNKRFYDLKVIVDDHSVFVRNVNLTNLNFSLNLHEIQGTDLSEIVTLYKPFVGVASNSTGFDDNSVNLVFNYTGYNYDSASNLGVVKCSSWNYTSRKCLSSWSAVTSSIDRDLTQIEGNSTGFSAYFLAENKCGNGLCEVTYAETTSTCPSDCKETTVSVTTSGGGGGGGSSSSYYLTELEKLIKNFINVGGIKIETTSIYKEMFAGDTTTFRIKVANTLSSGTTISLSADSDVKQFLFFETSQVNLGVGEQRDILVKVVSPKLIDAGNYDGDLIIKAGSEEGRVPVTIRILSPEGKLLDVKIQPLTPSVRPGGILRLQTDLLNLGKTKKVDIQFDLQLLDINTGEILARNEEAFAVETTISTIKNITIPEDTPVGKYMVKGTASYSNVEQSNMQASSIAYVYVQYSFLQRKILWIPLWVYLLLLVLVSGGFGGSYYLRWLEFRTKRFKTKVEFNKLPSVSGSSIFVGKVAETEVRTFMDLNKLQMHTLVAGATGSGKTVAAQDIIEGALLHNKSVIIFDPTAQWTGFFKPCEDKTMLKRFKYFDMKIKDARGFNGVIKTIKDPYELINIKDYIGREGEITIFNISNLTPKEIDIVVASTIQQIFKSQPDESKDLKTLIVYDEVHRLLPKFGGSGEGFVQLERGCREFRKWGIGLVLISQVLSDFVGEIKANIGTEVQLGTRYEGDLERVSMKYGEDVLKSVVKEPIGTGMVVNAEYNSGRPYFVSFRPLMHSTKRLTNEELSRYEKYFEEIEDLDFQTSELKKLEIDVLDLELEIKLAKTKIKEGQFQMADMYLESLRPRIAETWKKAGKTPRHLVKVKIKSEEVQAGIETAKKEREKFIKKNPEEIVSYEQIIRELDKSLEEKKKKGVKTSEIEIKLEDLKNRLKPFKGQIPSKDAVGIKEEVEKLKKDISTLK